MECLSYGTDGTWDIAFDYVTLHSVHLLPHPRRRIGYRVSTFVVPRESFLEEKASLEAFDWCVQGN
jgi:hypothetical protein